MSQDKANGTVAQVDLFQLKGMALFRVPSQLTPGGVLIESN